MSSQKKKGLRKRHKFFLVVSLVVVILLGVIYYFDRANVNGNVVKQEDLTDFVSCLNDHNVKLYGYGNSSALGYQADLFGEYFSDLNYIDCSSTPLKCEGVLIFPTWEIRGRPVHGSTLSLEVLGTLAECEL
jgi:hypothetical protein